MCKKLFLVVGAIIVGLSVISFTGLRSLALVKWHDTRGWLERQVPPETQLKQLQLETDKIDKDIKRHLSKLAAQEVEFERLEANVVSMKEQQTKLRSEVADMTKALDSKEQKVSFNGRVYRPSELAMRLDSLTNTYEIRKTEIKTKEQLLTSKRQSLELAHQRIGEMRDQKEKLRVTVAQLETRIEMVKLKQVDCPIEVDGSQVNKCNLLAEKLDKQLAEEEKKTELFHKYGYDNEKKTSMLRDERTREEVLQAAKRVLQEDDDKVVEK